MKINATKILPSQDFLKDKTVLYIFECLKHQNYEGLPPMPIVREDSDGNLVAIDGHNLIAVMAYLNKDIEVHLAKSPHDGLPEISQSNIDRNKDLKDKFESALSESLNVQKSGIISFIDLVNRNTELFENQNLNSE